MCRKYGSLHERKKDKIQIYFFSRVNIFREGFFSATPLEEKSPKQLKVKQVKRVASERLNVECIELIKR